MKKSSGDPGWQINQGALEKFDQRGPTPPNYSRALDTADQALDGFSADEKERICRLAEYAVPEPFFARGPEAKEVAELLDSLLRAPRLLFLLRRARASRTPRG